MIKLEKKAQEGSSYFVYVTCRDARGVAVIPSVLTWTLSTVEGTPINGRLRVPVSTPGIESIIVLSGNDLLLVVGAEYGRLLLTVEGLITSSIGGTLPIREQALLDVEAFVLKPIS